MLYKTGVQAVLIWGTGGHSSVRPHEYDTAICARRKGMSLMSAAREAEDRKRRKAGVREVQAVESLPGP